jgi:hypothetical protein
MKNYYIRQKDKKQGPYSIDQLKEMKINPTAPVWTEGLKEWIRAREIPELQQALFAASPQFVPANSATGNEYFKSSIENTGFVAGRNWKTALVVLALILIAFFIIKLQSSEGHLPSFETATLSAKNSTDLKKERRRKEMEHPADYIKAKMSWHKNLIGEIVLEGTLHNTATLANFKDPVMLITWLSKTNTPVGTNRYPLYEYLGTGKTIRYKLKVKAPSKIGDVKVSVESATAIQ